MVSKRWLEFSPESKFRHPISTSVLPQFYLFVTSFFTSNLAQFNLCSAGNLEPRFGNHGLQTLRSCLPKRVGASKRTTERPTQKNIWAPPRELQNLVWSVGPHLNPITTNPVLQGAHHGGHATTRFLESS